MNAYHLLLIAGVLAVLAIGVVGAAPGGNPAVAVGAAPSCTLHVSLNAPTQLRAGPGQVSISAIVTDGHCGFTVSKFAFQGLPGTSGVVLSTTGVELVSTSTAGSYQISVTAVTSVGNVGAVTVMQVL